MGRTPDAPFGLSDKIRIKLKPIVLHDKIIIKIYLSENKEVTLLTQLIR